MKIIRCLTHQPIVDRDKWIYPCKEYRGTASFIFSEYEDTINEHRVPSFLSLHAHMTIEHAIEALYSLFFTQFPLQITLLPYTIFHGLLCTYNMKQILQFWKQRD